MMVYAISRKASTVCPRCGGRKSLTARVCMSCQQEAVRNYRRLRGEGPIPPADEGDDENDEQRQQE